MYRFVVIVWNPLNVAAARSLESCRTGAFKSPQWSVAHQGPGVIAWHMEASRGSATAHILHRSEGVVLGRCSSGTVSTIPAPCRCNSMKQTPDG